MGLLQLLRLLLQSGADRLRSHAELRAENALLRHQLLIATRGKKKPRLTAADRTVFVYLYRRHPKVFDALALVKLQTVVRWHRAGYRMFLRWKSRCPEGRPPTKRELKDLIRRLCFENPFWGAPRIHGEIQKLNYEICEATVAKYMFRYPPGVRMQSFKAFLRLHARGIVAIDMLTAPTLFFGRLYAFVVLDLGRREILHIEVTTHPTAQWLARQIAEAFPGDTPKFLMRDNDGAYGKVFRLQVKAMGIRDFPITPHSPWQNGYVERVIGSIKRDCLDHIIPFNAEHLRSVLREYVEYYNNDRTHLGLEKDSPRSRPVEAEGAIVARPILGGLHHRYSRKSIN